MQLCAESLPLYAGSVHRSFSFRVLIGSEICAKEESHARIEFLHDQAVGVIVRSECIAGVPRLEEIAGDFAVGQFPGSLAIKTNVDAEGGAFDANRDEQEVVLGSGG